MSTAITSSTLTDGTLCLVSANRDFGLGAAMPATSPPTIAPATSTAPTETHQRMAALPSFQRLLQVKNGSDPASSASPFYPQEQTSSDHPGMSEKCRYCCKSPERRSGQFL